MVNCPHHTHLISLHQRTCIYSW